MEIFITILKILPILNLLLRNTSRIKVSSELADRRKFKENIPYLLIRTRTKFKVFLNVLPFHQKKRKNSNKAIPHFKINSQIENWFNFFIDYWWWKIILPWIKKISCIVKMCYINTQWRVLLLELLVLIPNWK